MFFLSIEEPNTCFHFLIPFPVRCRLDGKKNVFPEEPFVSISWWREMSSLIWKGREPRDVHLLLSLISVSLPLNCSRARLGILVTVLNLSHPFSNHGNNSVTEQPFSVCLIQVWGSIFALLLLFFVLQSSLSGHDLRKWVWKTRKDFISSPPFILLLWKSEWTSFTFAYFTLIFSDLNCHFGPNHARFAPLLHSSSVAKMRLRKEQK